MFDIGFWELAMIAVIALLVVGPERLPRLARTAGIWFGKIRGFVANVKADVERELRAEELKRIVEEQAKNTGVHEIVEETRSSLESTRSSLDESQQAINELERDFRRSQEGGKPEGRETGDKDLPPPAGKSGSETSSPATTDQMKSEKARRQDDE